MPKVAKKKSAVKRRAVAKRAPAKKKVTAKKAPARKKQAPASGASRLIDQRIRELGDWRGRTLARLRALIRAAVPGIREEWKWDVPVWSSDGIICTGETYKKAVKLTFAKGASVPDPSRLFNSSLQGGTRRAIDFAEGAPIDEPAFKVLIKAAAQLNAAPKTARLLSGGNPQIAKADGDAPVQAWIAALPGWKRDVGARFDALVARTVPGVVKAVKWNSPLYGVADSGFFCGLHLFDRYLKVAFFKGASFVPELPVGSKDPNTRYVHLTEHEFDEAAVAEWVRQAAALPGWTPGRP